MGPLLRMQTRLHSEGCRKMCCPNGSRKLHFVQKIRLGRIINYLGLEEFFAHLRNFLQVLDLHIFRQKQPGH